MSKSNYWRRRQLQILESAYKDTEKELIELYRLAISRIMDELTKVYVEICNNNAPLISKLYQYQRYYRMIKELQSIMRDLGVAEEKLFTHSMEQLYTDNYNKLGLTDFPAPKVDEETISRVIHQDWVGDGNNFSDRIWKNKAELAKKAKDYVMLSIAEGKNPTQFLEDLKPYIKGEGLWKAKRLLITEMAHVQRMSTIARYKAEGVKKVEILTAGDKKVCEACQELAQYEYDIDNVPDITHPNCRCDIIPVISGD